MNDERRAAPLSEPPDSGALPTVPDLGSPASSKPDIAPATSFSAPSSSRPPGRDSSPGVRRRSRLALRIPDDEVVRPQPSTPEPGEAAHDDSQALAIDLVSPQSQRNRAPSISPIGPPLDLALDDVLGPSPVLTPSRIISIDAEPDGSITSVDPAAPSEPDGEEVHFDEPPQAAEASPAVLAPGPRDGAAVLAPGPRDGAAVLAPGPRDGAVVLSGPFESSADEPDAIPSEVNEGELSADDLVALDATPSPPKVIERLPSMRPRLPSHPPVHASAASTKSAHSLPAPRSGRPPLVIVPPHMGSVPPHGPEGSGFRRKGRFWWEELFNDDYLRTTERLSEEQLLSEVDFVEERLGIERGGAVLDLACGTGRHAVELARRGYEVVGFDLSLAMLARASEEAQERGAKLNFVQGDMREMSFAEQFDGVYCWNTSFGYFEDDKNTTVVDRIRGALKAGGLLLLDVVNRDFVVQQSPSLAWFEGDGCVCMDEMVVDFITSRLRVKRTMMLDDGRSREIEYSMRVYSLHELGKMLHDHGFKVCEVSGRTSTPGVFFGHESPRTIVLAEKR
jgi:SAM-dependent methyltransferase